MKGIKSKGVIHIKICKKLPKRRRISDTKRKKKTKRGRKGKGDSVTNQADPPLEYFQSDYVHITREQLNDFGKDYMIHWKELLRAFKKNCHEIKDIWSSEYKFCYPDDRIMEQLYKEYNGDPYKALVNEMRKLIPSEVKEEALLELKKFKQKNKRSLDDIGEEKKYIKKKGETKKRYKKSKKKGKTKKKYKSKKKGETKGKYKSKKVSKVYKKCN